STTAELGVNHLVINEGITVSPLPQGGIRPVAPMRIRRELIEQYARIDEDHTSLRVRRRISSVRARQISPCSSDATSLSPRDPLRILRRSNPCFWGTNSTSALGTSPYFCRQRGGTVICPFAVSFIASPLLRKKAQSIRSCVHRA